MLKFQPPLTKFLFDIPQDRKVPLRKSVGQNQSSRKYMYVYVRSNTIHKSQDMETSEMPTNAGMDKEDMQHIDNGILRSH